MSSTFRDLLSPVVDFLSTRGIKTIYGEFPGLGNSHLSQTCWASVPIEQIKERFRFIQKSLNL